MYVVEMQYVPNLDVAWVERLLPSDLIFSFATYEEADAKAKELESLDPTGRKFRVKTIN